MVSENLILNATSSTKRTDPALWQIDTWWELSCLLSCKMV